VSHGPDALLSLPYDLSPIVVTAHFELAQQRMDGKISTEVLEDLDDFAKTFDAAADHTTSKSYTTSIPVHPSSTIHHLLTEQQAHVAPSSVRDAILAAQYSTQLQMGEKPSKKLEKAYHRHEKLAFFAIAPYETRPAGIYHGITFTPICSLNFQIPILLLPTLLRFQLAQIRVSLDYALPTRACVSPIVYATFSIITV